VGYHYEDVDLVVRSQKSEIRSQKSEVRSQKSEVRNQKSEIKKGNVGRREGWKGSEWGIGISEFGIKRLENGRKNKEKRKNEIDREELIDLAYESFCGNLERLRENFDVKTICMHGSPLSRFDNRIIWEKYDYRELGIIGEPYLDVDFSEVFYLTDTGRRWDGVSVRDKVGSRQYEVSRRKAEDRSQRSEGGNQKSEIRNQKSEIRSQRAGKLMNEEKMTLNEKLGLRFRSTGDIIETACNGLLLDRIMITVHPQRWSDSFIPWFKEFVWQNVKNQVKKYVVRSM
jgi:hypothetical protein